MNQESDDKVMGTALLSTSSKAQDDAPLSPDLPLLINRQSAVPLHIQIKEQIRYAIISSHYLPGQMLPSIREITAKLKVHRNTVHRVYLELQASGLLISLPGKGVFVNETLAHPISANQVDAANRLIEKYFEDANGLGINPLTFSRWVSQRAPDFDVRRPTVGFVECTAHQSQHLAARLSQQLGLHVQHWLLDDLRRNAENIPQHLQHIATSMFHHEEVMALLSPLNRRVHAISFDLHPESFRSLEQLTPNKTLGFICHDANTEEVIGHQIETRVPAGMLVGCANLEAPEHAIDLLSKVETVAFTEPATQFCIKHCNVNHELLEMHFAFNPASLEHFTQTVLYQH